jgi:hypothetical protein
MEQKENSRKGKHLTREGAQPTGVHANGSSSRPPCRPSGILIRQNLCVIVTLRPE